jgi:hypothetical protein
MGSQKGEDGCSQPGNTRGRTQPNKKEPGAWTKGKSDADCRKQARDDRAGPERKRAWEPGRAGANA